MIIDLLIGLFDALVSWVAGLLPDADTTSWWNGFAGFAAHMSDLNYYLPLAEVFTFTVGFSTVFVLLGPVKIVLWLLSWVRGGAQA